MLQSLQGYPDSLVGWLLAMRGLGMVGGFYIAGRMGHIDPRISMAVGFVLIGISGLALAVVETNAVAEWIAWAGLLQGIGSGILWVPVTTAAFATLAPRLLPDGAAIFHLLRNVGQSIYIALSFIVVIRAGQINYAELMPNLSIYNERLSFPWVTGLWSINGLTSIKALSGELSRQAQLIAFNNAFLMYTWTCFAVVPLVLLWRKGKPAQ